MKPKNCEGYDRILLRIIIDEMQTLILPLTQLFNKMYERKKITEQWFISKFSPILKKGKSSNISNYHPISNLCFCSEISEKLFLFRINAHQTQYKIDIIGESQHGFKSYHSKLMASLCLRSLFARAVDGDMGALMASLDLSMAFDVINNGLLLEPIKK